MTFIIIELQLINLQYGHRTGNHILQRWGRLFQTTFKGTQVLGYWGNGEFVLGIPGLTKQQTSECLEHFLTTLRQQVFTAPDTSRFQISFSFGIAEYPTDGLSLQSLYKFANTASYKTHIPHFRM